MSPATAKKRATPVARPTDANALGRASMPASPGPTCTNIGNQAGLHRRVQQLCGGQAGAHPRPRR